MRRKTIKKRKPLTRALLHLSEHFRKVVTKKNEYPRFNRFKSWIFYKHLYEIALFSEYAYKNTI